MSKGGNGVAKCPECEHDTFKVITHENKTFCYVQCEKCEVPIGVLEDIDFKDAFKTIREKLKLVTNNQVGIDRLINERTRELKNELKKDLVEQHEKIDYILSVIEKLNSRLD
jgi:hypothetical protein